VFVAAAKAGEGVFWQGRAEDLSLSAVVVKLAQSARPVARAR
jgi:hypothetical protein